MAAWCVCGRGAPVVPAGAAFRTRKSFLALDVLASLEDRGHVLGRVLAMVGSPCADCRGWGLEGEYFQTGGCVREVFQTAY